MINIVIALLLFTVFILLEFVFLNYIILNKYLIYPHFIAFLIKYFKILKPNIFLYISFSILITFIIIYYLKTYIIKEIRKQKNKKTINYGDAKWADDKEYDRAGYLSKKATGVIMGQTNDAVFKEVLIKDPITKKRVKEFKIKKNGSYLIQHPLDGHTLVIGSTRSGKGINVINTTAIGLKESLIVNDIKGELFEITSGRRAEFSRVVKWDILDVENSIKINPLTLIDLGNNTIRDVHNLVSTFISSESSKTTDSFWVEDAKALLSLLIMHTLLFEKDKTMYGVYTVMLKSNKQPNLFFEELVAKYSIIEVRKELMPVLELIRKTASKYAKMPAETLGGVIANMNTRFQVFEREDVRELTSESSIHPIDFIKGVRPLTLYMCIPANNQESISPISKLIIEIIINFLTEKINEERKHKVLFLLDEFPQLKYMASIEKAIPYTAGFGVYFMIIIQSFGNLKQYYKSPEALIDNFNYQIFLKTASHETAEQISRTLGKHTVIKTAASFSGNASSMLSNVSESISEVAVPLLDATQLLNISFTDGIVFIGGKNPYFIKKIMSYMDSRFKDYFTKKPSSMQLPSRDYNNWNRKHFDISKELREEYERKYELMKESQRKEEEIEEVNESEEREIDYSFENKELKEQGIIGI